VVEIAGALWGTSCRETDGGQKFASSILARIVFALGSAYGPFWNGPLASTLKPVSLQL